jgi:cyclopropane-fatty-acyl-phospholipid synthase
VLFAGTFRIFWKFFNLPGRAKRNSAHHYDLKNSLFDQFLDPRRQYFCRCFHTASDRCANHQAGAPWGKAVFTAKSESSKYCLWMKRACQCVMGNAAGYFGNRHQRGSFDRIVSIGMLEHVGMRHLNSYFALIAWLLAPNGLTLVHSIGVHHNTKRCTRWLSKYIFHGDYTPTFEQMTSAAGRQGLKILYTEIMRGHYT